MQQHTAIEPKTEWTKSSRVEWVWHWPLSTMRKWLMMNKEEIRYKAWDSTRLVQTLRPTARSFLRCLIRCAPLASYTHIKKPPVKAHFFEVIARRPGHSHELSEYVKILLLLNKLFTVKRHFYIYFWTLTYLWPICFDSLKMKKKSNQVQMLKITKPCPQNMSL